MESFTSEAGLAILEQNKDAYRDARGRVRRKVVIRVFQQLVLIMRVRGQPNKKKLRKQCFTWFQNHAGHRKEPKDTTRRWSWRAVVRAERKEELETMVRDVSGAKPGSKAYFGKYQKCLSVLCKGLDEDEKQHYEEMAELWSQRGPPQDVKRKLAETKAGEMLARLSKEMFRDCGVRIFVMYGYKDTHDQTCVAKYDDNAQYDGDGGFTTKHREWKDNTWKEWNQYVTDVFGNAEAEEEEEDDNVPARRPQDRSVPRELEVDERGWPLLPDWSADWPLPLLKQLIRSFVTLCYRKRCQNRKASVPWKEVAAQPNKFIRGKYLPVNAALGDPSHITLKQGRRLYQWWYDRQAAGDKALRFERCAPRHIPRRLRGNSPTKARVQKKRHTAGGGDHSSGRNPGQPPRSERQERQRRGAPPLPSDEDPADSGDEWEEQPPPRKIGPPRGARRTSDKKHAETAVEGRGQPPEVVIKIGPPRGVRRHDGPRPPLPGSQRTAEVPPRNVTPPPPPRRKRARSIPSPRSAPLQDPHNNIDGEHSDQPPPQKIGPPRGARRTSDKKHAETAVEGRGQPPEVVIKIGPPRGVRGNDGPRPPLPGSQRTAEVPPRNVTPPPPPRRKRARSTPSPRSLPLKAADTQGGGDLSDDSERSYQPRYKKLERPWAYDVEDNNDVDNGTARLHRLKKAGGMETNRPQSDLGDDFIDEPPHDDRPPKVPREDGATPPQDRKGKHRAVAPPFGGVDLEEDFWNDARDEDQVKFRPPANDEEEEHSGDQAEADNDEDPFLALLRRATLESAKDRHKLAGNEAGPSNLGGAGPSRRKSAGPNSPPKFTGSISDAHAELPENLQPPVMHMRTQKQRHKYLDGLCDLRWYKALVKEVKGAPVKPQMSLIQAKKHSWITWLHDESYLPEYFHTQPGFAEFCRWLNAEDPPWMYVSNERHSRQELEVICLSIGLAIREILAMQQLEPDEPLPAEVPAYWLGSSADFNALESTFEPAAQRLIEALRRESFNTPANEVMKTRKKTAREKETELNAGIKTRSKAQQNPPGKPGGKRGGGRR